MNFNATLFGQLLAFLFFVWFCMKYVWPPMLAALEEREKELIKKALKKHNGKRKNAAKELGISERTLYRKIKEFEILK